MKGLKLKTFKSAIFLLAFAGSVNAFQIESGDSDKSFATTTDGVAVMKIDGATYTIADLPISASGLEMSESPRSQPELVAKLNFGDPITPEEITKALDWYFKNTAINYDSIKLRNLKIDKPMYVIWCPDYVFTCLSGWTARAGTVITYEANGQNRSGGSSGFTSRIQAIRKVGAKNPTDSKVDDFVEHKKSTPAEVIDKRTEQQELDAKAIARGKANSKNQINVLGIRLGDAVASYPACDSEEGKTRICSHRSTKFTFIELRPERPKFIASNSMIIEVDGLIKGFSVDTKGLKVQQETYEYLVSRYGTPYSRKSLPVQNMMGARFESITARWKLPTGREISFEGVKNSIEKGEITVY